jgi:hypothetical protein
LAFVAPVINDLNLVQVKVTPDKWHMFTDICPKSKRSPDFFHLLAFGEGKTLSLYLRVSILFSPRRAERDAEKMGKNKMGENK